MQEVEKIGDRYIARLRLDSPASVPMVLKRIDWSFRPERGPEVKGSTLLDLRLAPEFVQQVDLLNWCEHRDEWGDASLRMPIFETWRTNTAVTLINGQFELVSVFTPRPADPVPG